MFLPILRYFMRQHSYFSSRSCWYSLSTFNKTNLKYRLRECNMILTISPRSFSLSVCRSCINLKNTSLARYVLRIQDEYNQCLINRNAILTVETDRAKVDKVMGLVQIFRGIEDNIASLDEMKNSTCLNLKWPITLKERYQSM